MFRLPSNTDQATLTIEQVAGALADQPSTPIFRVSLKSDGARPERATLEIENQGTANAAGNLRIDVAVEPSSIESVTALRGASVETLCRVSDANNQTVFEPCSLKRANVIRISATGLRHGQILTASVIFNGLPRERLPVSIEAETDNGQTFRDQSEIHLTGGLKR